MGFPLGPVSSRVAERVKRVQLRARAKRWHLSSPGACFAGLSVEQIWARPDALIEEMAATMETPSGKTAADENFPVGSWLLPARLRPHVATFYAYARAIDDIADNPDLQPDDKIQRLEGFAAAVRGVDTTSPGFHAAHAIRRSLAATDVTHQHCLDLVSAFKQDASKLRYESWNDLISYCNLSAAPVGRYLIDLHGESAATYPASDALCNALQVVNHLQDCGDDFRALNRVYLPQNWIATEEADISTLEGRQATDALRRVLNRCLDATDQLLVRASRLPAQFQNVRLAMESATIIAIAKKLSAELRRRDPLAERVVLTKAQFLGCGVSGVGHALYQTIPRWLGALASRPSSVD